jgi:hypothetical protein
MMPEAERMRDRGTVRQGAPQLAKSRAGLALARSFRDKASAPPLEAQALALDEKKASSPAAPALSRWTRSGSAFGSECRGLSVLARLARTR